jgi:hypothetical protein
MKCDEHGGAYLARLPGTSRTSAWAGSNSDEICCACFTSTYAADAGELEYHSYAIMV